MCNIFYYYFPLNFLKFQSQIHEFSNQNQACLYFLYFNTIPMIIPNIVAKFDIFKTLLHVLKPSSAYDRPMDSVHFLYSPMITLYIIFSAYEQSLKYKTWIIPIISRRCRFKSKIICKIKTDKSFKSSHFFAASLRDDSGSWDRSRLPW